MKKRLLLAMAAGLMMSTAASAQTLRIGLNEDPDVLDPHRARTFVGRIVFTSLCDKLVDITPDLKFTPATRDGVELGRRRQVADLQAAPRREIPDGEPMNAAAVKANIDRARTLPDSLRKSELTSVDKRRGRRRPDREGQSVPPRRDPALAALRPRRHDHVAEGPRLGRLRARSRSARAPTSSSSASRTTASSWRGSRITGTRRTSTSSASSSTPIPDTTVRLANLRSGNLDIIERLAPSDVPAAKGDANLVFAPVTGIGYQGLTINTNNGERAKTPLGQDKRVRQALRAVDRPQRDQRGRGRRASIPPAGQPFPEASPYNNPKFAADKRDVAKAKQLLKEAGVERVKFELTFGNRHDGSADRRDHPGDGGRGGLRHLAAADRVRRHAEGGPGRQLRRERDRLVRPRRSRRQHPSPSSPARVA